MELLKKAYPQYAHLLDSHKSRDITKVVAKCLYTGHLQAYFEDLLYLVFYDYQAVNYLRRPSVRRGRDMALMTATELKEIEKRLNQ